jgi:hypothetical protein
MKKIIVDFISVIFEYALAFYVAIGLDICFSARLQVSNASIIAGLLFIPIAVIILVYGGYKLRSQKSSNIFQIKVSKIILLIDIILIGICMYFLYFKKNGPFEILHSKEFGYILPYSAGFLLTLAGVFITSWLLVCLNRANNKLRIFQLLGILFFVLTFLMYFQINNMQSQLDWEIQSFHG